MRIAKVGRTGRLGEAGSEPMTFVHSYHLLYGESNRVSRIETAFEMLEPCASKGASTVLRELGAGNRPRLLDLLYSDLNRMKW